MEDSLDFMRQYHDYLWYKRMEKDGLWKSGSEEINNNWRRKLAKFLRSMRKNAQC